VGQSEITDDESLIFWGRTRFVPLVKRNGVIHNSSVTKEAPNERALGNSSSKEIPAYGAL
jgi:hypothetical protein